MTTKIKTLLVTSLACAAIGFYSITSAHEPSVGDRSVPMTGGISVESTEPILLCRVLYMCSPQLKKRRSI